MAIAASSVPCPIMALIVGFKGLNRNHVDKKRHTIENVFVNQRTNFVPNLRKGKSWTNRLLSQ